MVKKIVFIVLVFFVMVKVVAQKKISGKVLMSEGLALEQVLVVNMKTGVKILTDADGEFKISAEETEELRLIRKGYERISHYIKSTDFEKKLIFKMQKPEVEIEEVVIANFSKGKMEKLQESIGVPHVKKGTPSSPRVANLKSVLSSILSLSPSLNLNDIQDLVTGDSRRRKALYKYENFQEKVYWVKDRIEVEFFTKREIPEERITEFITFAITEKTEIKYYIKARNLVQIKNVLKNVLPTYVERLKKSDF